MKNILSGLLSIMLLFSLFGSTQTAEAATPSLPSGCKITGKLTAAQVKKTYNKIDKHASSRTASLAIVGTLAGFIPFYGYAAAGTIAFAGYLDSTTYGMWAKAAANNKRAVLYNCKPKYHSELNGPIDTNGIKFY